MSPIAEYVGKQIAGEVIHEAINEAAGTSKRKWALVVVGLVLAVVVARVVVRRRGETSTDPSEEQ